MHSKYLTKLAQELFEDPEARERFVNGVMMPGGGVKSLIWIKERPEAVPFTVLEKQGFEPDFVDSVSEEDRPGSHPMHDQGYFYCLDRSSIFSASAVLGLNLCAPRILVMCASPGGKSVFSFRAHAPSLMVSNEVIGKRLGALISNLKRLGVSPVSVTCADSKIWASDYAAGFDLVLCDVPCSGQSLIRKASDAPGCFHPATVNMNSNRQKRIVANALQTVSGGGYLSYMTCTFSPAENERVMEWVFKKFPHFEAIEVSHLAAFQSQLADFPCYRLWPHQELGAGAFVCVLRNTNLAAASEIDISRIRSVWRSE